MYSEKSFDNYIFWTKVRRIFLILLFSIIGCLLGIFISDIINTITINDSYRVIIISISTLMFFALSLLLTIGTAREVQDGYWKIETLNTLTDISKKLDKLSNLENFKEEFKDLESIKNNLKEIVENKSNEAKVEDKTKVEVEDKVEMQQEVKNEETPEDTNASKKIKKSKRTIAKIKTV